MTRITCDVHTHTLFSRHAYSTINENVMAAAEAGLELIGSTDHYSCMLFDEQTIRNFQFFINMQVWPRVWHGVQLLRGVEADIVDIEGRLFGHDLPIETIVTGAPMPPKTLKELVFSQCDYAIASVHDLRIVEGSTRTQRTEMYIKALQDPKVLILGHIGRSGVDCELEPVVSAARDLGKLIEINGTSISGYRRERTMSACHQVAECCAELGCQISFGSDAHICCDVGRTDEVVGLLDSIDFPQELVACRSAKAFMDVMKNAGLSV